ncbi:MAG: hypothetical protein E7057_03740 [Lentisphaerae bacterium]|nr:hypothetical protein [Lentisphaerota bacterium]
MRKIILLLTIFATLHAEELTMDINFDGHPDKLREVKRIDCGILFDVLLFNPADGKFHRDPVYSQLIAGGRPELNTAEKSIQCVFTPENGSIFPGYKFLVRNGKLCFADGKEIPEKVNWTWNLTRLSPELQEFDRRAGKHSYDEVLLKWQKLTAELEKYQIPYSAEIYCRRYNDGHRPDPQIAQRWQKNISKLSDELPEGAEFEKSTRNAVRLRQEFLQNNASSLELMEKFLQNPRDLFPAPVPGELLADQTFSFGRSFRSAAEIYAVKIAAAVDREDYTAAINEFVKSRQLLVNPSSQLHYMVNSGIRAILDQALCNVLYQAKKQGKLTPELLQRARKLTADDEKTALREFYHAVLMDCAYAFDLADLMIKGKFTSILKRDDGIILYFIARIIVEDKITSGKFYCRALEELKNDPYMTGKAENLFSPEALKFLDPAINLRLHKKPLFNILCRVRATAAALDYLENGKAPQIIDPYTGKNLLIYNGTFKYGINETPSHGIRLYSAGSNGKDEQGAGEDDIGIILFDRE